MALWMTVKKELFWLAVMLSLFCGAYRYEKRYVQKKRGMTPAFLFSLIFAGWIAGIGRMELEKLQIVKSEDFLNCQAGRETEAEGEICEIAESQSGFRLLLKECVVGLEEKTEIPALYCYVDSVDGMKIGMKVCVSGEAAVPDPDRNPGSFSYRSHCYARGVRGIFYGEHVTVMDSHWLVIREWARNMRYILERQLEKIASADDVGILKAILLGNKSEIDDAVYETYRKNGISHVLAISGLHVSVIGMGLWKMMRKSGISYVVSGAAAFLLLYFYGLIAGFGTSVARAVFMMGLSFASGICGRTYDLPSAMCVPALGLLFRYPYLLTQASFQLSFLAVAAIFFPGDYLAKKWELKGIASNILTSASIQFVTMPVVLWHSFEIPIYGILLNLAVIPLMTYVLVSGILGTIFSFFSTFAGTAALGGAHLILWFYQWICRGAERIPGGIFAPGRPEYGAMAGFYLCLLIGIFFAGRKKKTAGIFFLAAVLFLFPAPQTGFTAEFLDVGQGDGIVLRTESGAVLVDCGSSQKKEVGKDVLVPYLKCRGIRKLSAVFVSHGDSDHVNGIRYLLSEDTGISVDALVMPDTDGQDPVLTELQKLAEKKGIPVLYKHAGDALKAYLGDEVWMQCLHPAGKESGRTFDRNEDSMVLELRYGKFRMLLTGDMGTAGEEELMNRESLSGITVLKAGHHGSDTSTGDLFLNALQPSWVIFSYGRGNRYGHPSAAVVERCQRAGAEICETGKSGAAEIWTDGSRIRVRGWLDRKEGI